MTNTDASGDLSYVPFFVHNAQSGGASANLRWRKVTVSITTKSNVS